MNKISLSIFLLIYIYIYIYIFFFWIVFVQRSDRWSRLPQMMRFSYAPVYMQRKPVRSCQSVLAPPLAVWASTPCWLQLLQRPLTRTCRTHFRQKGIAINAPNTTMLSCTGELRVQIVHRYVEERDRINLRLLNNAIYRFLSRGPLNILGLRPVYFRDPWPRVYDICTWVAQPGEELT